MTYQIQLSHFSSVLTPPASRLLKLSQSHSPLRAQRSAPHSLVRTPLALRSLALALPQPLTPSRSHSLAPSLPRPSLPRSLSLSTSRPSPLCLAPSRSHSLSPSLPRARTPSHPRSLAPSLPRSIAPHSLAPSASLPRPSLPRSLSLSASRPRPLCLAALAFPRMPPRPPSLSLPPHITASTPLPRSSLRLIEIKNGRNLWL
ncbi:hypothetical protein ACB092_03G167900 [Castanea dentata]